MPFKYQISYTRVLAHKVVLPCQPVLRVPIQCREISGGMGLECTEARAGRTLQHRLFCEVWLVHLASAVSCQDSMKVHIHAFFSIALSMRRE